MEGVPTSLHIALLSLKRVKGAHVRSPGNDSAAKLRISFGTCKELPAYLGLFNSRA